MADDLLDETDVIIEALAEATERTVEELKETGIDYEVVDSWRGTRAVNLSPKEKHAVFTAYANGDIAEYETRRILGDIAFDDVQEMIRATEQMLSSDTSRFLTNE